MKSVLPFPNLCYEEDHLVEPEEKTQQRNGEEDASMLRQENKGSMRGALSCGSLHHDDWMSSLC